MSRPNHIANCIWLCGIFILSSSFHFHCFAISFCSGEERSTPQYGDLFQNNDILKVTIFSDFASIMDDRGEDRSYHKGVLYYITGSLDTITRKVKLKTRGNFRRDPANCKYPPIMVKFGKQKSPDPIFSGQQKLKLVTQCQLENYVLLEYLAYRMYNTLTENSYRVRLAHITYADLATREAYFTRYAFFIESEQELMHRLEAEKYRPYVVEYFLEKDNIQLVAMFQYMIGNNDWFVRSKHNITIMQLADKATVIAVPFDFDWSEFVDAEYTKPRGAPTYLLAERQVYKGLCLNKKEFDRQREIFMSRKEVIIDLLSSLDDLPDHQVRAAQRYIGKFYKVLDSKSSLSKIFQREQCIEETVIKGH